MPFTLKVAIFMSSVLTAKRGVGHDRISLRQRLGQTHNRSQIAYADKCRLPSP